MAGASIVVRGVEIRTDAEGNFKAERVPPEDGLGEQVVYLVAGLVVVHRDLFENHPALGLHVGGGEHGVGDEVADDVHGQLYVRVEHPRVVARVLLGGERVGLPTDGLDLGGDLQRAAPLGALEEQVLQEMRDARLHRRLVAGANADPDAE